MTINGARARNFISGRPRYLESARTLNGPLSAERNFTCHPLVTRAGLLICCGHPLGAGHPLERGGRPAAGWRSQPASVPPHRSRPGRAPGRGRPCRAFAMRSYQPADWHDLFVASAGAAAALTGLIFVAVSINLAQILADRKLPTRAAETLSILVGLVLLSVFMLVPGQGRIVLGIEIGGRGVVLGTILLTNRL